MTRPFANSSSPHPTPVKATRVDAFLLIVIGAAVLLIPFLRPQYGFGMVSLIIGLCALLGGVLALIKRGGVA